VKKKKKKKRDLYIIAQYGVSDLFLLFFKFFDGNQTKGTTMNGRKGNFFSTFDRENMNQRIPLSIKEKCPH